MKLTETIVKSSEVFPIEIFSRREKLKNNINYGKGIRRYSNFFAKVSLERKLLNAF